MLVQGAFFDSSIVRELPFDKRRVSRVLHNLIDSGVILKTTRRGKYLFTDGFLSRLKGEIARGAGHRIFIPIPDLEIFDVVGVEHWTEQELEVYTKGLKDRWLLRTGRRVTEPLLREQYS